jgi:hypothetical protein
MRTLLRKGGGTDGTSEAVAQLERLGFTPASKLPRGDEDAQWNRDLKRIRQRRR